MRDIKTRMVPGDLRPIRLRPTRACPGCGQQLLIPEDATALSAAASAREFDRKHARCRAAGEVAAVEPSP